MAIRKGDNIILHEFTEFRRRSNRKKGRALYAIEMQGTPILHDFDERKLGKKVTDAIKDAIEEDFAKISQTITQSTYERRQRAIKSSNSVATAKRQKTKARRASGAKKAAGPRVARAAKSATKKKQTSSSKWYRERYMGGTTGHTPPRGGKQWGEDSGRLSEHLVVIEGKDKSFGIKSVVNRLREDMFEDPKRPGYTFMEFARDLSKNVPALNPLKLAQHPKIRAAVEGSISDLIQTAANRMRGTRAEFFKQFGRKVFRGGTRFLMAA